MQGEVGLGLAAVLWKKKVLAIRILLWVPALHLFRNIMTEDNSDKSIFHIIFKEFPLEVYWVEVDYWNYFVDVCKKSFENNCFELFCQQTILLRRKGNISQLYIFQFSNVHGSSFSRLRCSVIKCSQIKFQESTAQTFRAQVFRKEMFRDKVFRDKMLMDQNFRDQVFRDTMVRFTMFRYK